MSNQNETFEERVTKLPFSKFKYLGALFCLIGDLLTLAYINAKIQNGYEWLQPIILDTFQRQGIARSHVDDSMIQEIFTLLQNACTLFIILILVVQLIAYLLFILEKKSAKKYAMAIVWVAGPGFILAAISFILTGRWILVLPTLAQAILYYIVYLNLKKEKTAFIKNVRKEDL